MAPAVDALDLDRIAAHVQERDRSADGRMRTVSSTIDLWIAGAARSEEPSPAFLLQHRLDTLVARAGLEG
ncbi:MAG: hypothetical protein QOE86_2261 [Solirubrobacteraceae bacterium]|jgi:hypothetical protein|nr:hypothetical protein [Solirubrobacteraceae bacterium]